MLEGAGGAYRKVLGYVAATQPTGDLRADKVRDEASLSVTSG